MSLPVLLTLLYLVLLLFAEWRQSVIGKWMTKPVASAGFIWLAVQVGAWYSPWGKAVLAALVLSWLGDVLLIPKSKRAFLAGLGAFLLGHVAFVVAFLVRGVDWRVTVGLMLPLAIVGTLVLRWLKPHVSDRMWTPVIAYVVVITAMVATAFGTAAVGDFAGSQHLPQGFVQLGGPASNIAIGATMFWLSDLCVARNRFIKPGLPNRLLGLPLYYVAQLMLAAAAVASHPWSYGLVIDPSPLRWLLR